MITRKRILLFLLLIPVVCILCVGAILGGLYVRNQLRWRDDLTDIAAKAQPGDYEVSLEHDGRRRTYHLHLPTSYDGSTELPLVIALHGSIDNADYFRRVTHFEEMGDAEGFIAVHPNGSGRLPNYILTWNIGRRCCGYSTRIDSDDVGFLRALIESLSAELAVNPDRIYVAGNSNGGMMSLAVACELDDLVAGVGSVVGSMIWYPCEPEQPVSLIMINGREDRLVPYEGGWLENPGPIDDSVEGAIEFWTEHNACGDPTTTEAEGLAIDDYENCAGGSAVRLIAVIDGGHEWYSGSDPVDTPEALWEFFAAHPKVR